MSPGHDAEGSISFSLSTSVDRIGSRTGAEKELNEVESDETEEKEEDRDIGGADMRDGEKEEKEREQESETVAA